MLLSRHVTTTARGELWQHHSAWMPGSSILCCHLSVSLSQVQLKCACGCIPPLSVHLQIGCKHWVQPCWYTCLCMHHFDNNWKCQPGHSDGVPVALSCTLCPCADIPSACVNSQHRSIIRVYCCSCRWGLGLTLSTAGAMALTAAVFTSTGASYAAVCLQHIV
jgi:hypothetical protein